MIGGKKYYGKGYYLKIVCQFCRCNLSYLMTCYQTNYSTCQWTIIIHPVLDCYFQISYYNSWYNRYYYRLHILCWSLFQNIFFLTFLLMVFFNIVFTYAKRKYSYIMLYEKLKYKAFCITYYSFDNHSYIRLDHPHNLCKYNLSIILIKKSSSRCQIIYSLF